MNVYVYGVPVPDVATTCTVSHDTHSTHYDIFCVPYMVRGCAGFPSSLVLGRVSARANEPLFHSFALGGFSLPVSHVHSAGERRVWQPSPAAVAAACQRRLALRARRVLGADGVGAVRPGACGEPDHRLALRARRRGRCAPVHRAGQPLAAIADSRYVLSAEGVGAARPVACGSRVAASRYALGA